MGQIQNKCVRSVKRRDPRSTESFATLDTKFPIDNLPPEIIHLIHKYLGPTDVAKIRHVSQRVAQIGLEYLVPCIHLQLTTASYNRLSAISRHPVISKHVFEIRYESDVMKQFSWEDFKKWRMTSREPASSIHERRSRRPCTRAQYKLEEEHEQSEMEKIQAAYQVHQSFLKDQSELERQAFLSSEVSGAFLRLPNLIRLQTGGLWNHERFLRSLQVIFCRDLEGVKIPEGGWYWPSGLSSRGIDLGLNNAPITATILHGLGWAKSNIEQLVNPRLHWRVFWQTDSGYNIIKGSLCKVRRMKVAFDGPKGLGQRGEREHLEFEECLTKKRPFEFLTCCPGLTHLDLTWHECISDDEFDLRHFLGDFIWHHLSSVTFGNFCITEAAFIIFFARHSTSLDQLSLQYITLTEGTWYSTFNRMRKVLRLKKVSVSGVFYQYDDDDWWMYPDPYWNKGKQPYGDYVKEYLEDHSDREMRLDVLVRDGHV